MYSLKIIIIVIIGQASQCPINVLSIWNNATEVKKKKIYMQEALLSKPLHMKVGRFDFENWFVVFVVIV